MRKRPRPDFSGKMASISGESERRWEEPQAKRKEQETAAAGESR